MSSLLSEIFLEAELVSEATRPAAGVAVRKRVRHFICNSADHKKVEDLMKMSVSDATLTASIERVVATAISWIYTSIATLRISPRNARTIGIFQRAFAQPPGWNPPWKNATMKWVDWGDLIATRLEKAAHILNGGEIKYFCYGSSTHCSECTDPPSVYISCSSFKGRYTICLGDAFWADWKSSNWNSLASNLLHEALHIYFGTTIAHTGRSGNASCYQRFVSEINGIPLLARLASRCPSSP